MQIYANFLSCHRRVRGVNKTPPTSIRVGGLTPPPKYLHSHALVWDNFPLHSQRISLTSYPFRDWNWPDAVRYVRSSICGKKIHCEPMIDAFERNLFDKRYVRDATLENQIVQLDLLFFHFLHFLFDFSVDDSTVKTVLHVWYLFI